MVCRDFILSLACKSCLFLFAQLIVPYQKGQTLNMFTTLSVICRAVGLSGELCPVLLAGIHI